ncbi:sulfatase [Paludicola sp. MB14-C6]|uniref:sulfatase n=1 Tax=Paludihabitans sp. MB14-C6 TaxID=3070656 RepID=UPI0027DBD79A|nr:sulfatase [Paludicola sp. MB14-C6]WMJ23494.1 sulfatase [Paludicola sp. MB14-C6]
MRVLMFDIDTLRSDHLGCYGYQRNTSPTIDQIASEGVRFDNYYCPNAPCLPSRASFITGQYGIRTGVVGHGGTAADLRLQGTNRHFTDDFSENGLFMQFRRAGMHTVSFSTFAERHSSWWFNSGFNECYNVGGRGGESAEAVTPKVLDWIERNGSADNWFMHVHFWDPHTPYRAPKEFGNPFKDEPLADNWITAEVFKEHLLHIGPHGANEINMWNDDTNEKWPRHPGKLSTIEEMKEFMDNYDCGIKYTDDNIKMIIDFLKQKGLYDDDLAIIVTSDHGENMGELGIYGEHATADEPTCHIPMIIKWPNGKKGIVAEGFHDNVDLLPTIKELLNTPLFGNHYQYDGKSYAKTILNGEDCSKEAVILTQCCHVCQRSARFNDYVYIRTYHGGYHLFEKEMLFNVKLDPHQLNNIAGENPDLCAKGAKLILDWVDEMMKKSDYSIDPLWTVMREGGPEHARGNLATFIDRISGTKREYGIPLLRKMYPNG